MGERAHTAKLGTEGENHQHGPDLGDDEGLLREHGGLKRIKFRSV